MGTGIAWKLRNQAKKDFLSSNGTQTGQKTLASLTLKPMRVHTSKNAC